MREAQRCLVRSCIEEDANMPFEEIVARTRLPIDKVSEYIADVVLENGSMTKFFKNDIKSDEIVSPWELDMDDDLLDKYKDEISAKTVKMKPLMITKQYMEFERDKKTAQGKLEALKHAPSKGSRWLELKMKAQNEQIKLMGLDAPQVINVNVGLNRSKEERDSIFAASNARNLLPAGAI